MHHAINKYHLRLDVQCFLWPVYYIITYLFARVLASWSITLSVSRAFSSTKKKRKKEKRRKSLHRLSFSKNFILTGWEFSHTPHLYACCYMPFYNYVIGQKAIYFTCCSSFYFRRDACVFHCSSPATTFGY